MMKEKGDVFIDKSQITIQVLQKEGTFVGMYGNLIQQIHSGFLTETIDIESSESYYHSWRLLFELYTFLEYDIEEEYEKKNKYNKEIGKMISLMERYENVDITLNLNDLKISNKIIRRIVFKLGYHENAIPKSVMDEEPQNF